MNNQKLKIINKSFNTNMYNEKVYCLGTYPLCDPSHAMYAGVQEAKRLGVPLTIHAGRNSIKIRNLLIFL